MIDPNLGCQLGHSLPPLVAGRVSGEVELRVSKIVLIQENIRVLISTTNEDPSSNLTQNKPISPPIPTSFLNQAHTVDIRCRWWGDPGSGSLFTPRVFRTDSDEGLLPVTPANRIVFPLHSRWERMRQYFADAEQDGVIFDIIDPNTHLVTGCAQFDTSVLDVQVAPAALKGDVPLSLSRAIPIRLPPSETDNGGTIVGHLHLKVLVRTGALSIVKRILEDNVADSNGNRGRKNTKGNRRKRNERNERNDRNEGRHDNDERDYLNGAMHGGNKRTRTNNRERTTLMLPSMLNSFQLNEVLAENDSSSILERFPPSSTEHYRPGGREKGTDGSVVGRRKNHPAVTTSWSDARPLFAAADIFGAHNHDQENLTGEDIPPPPPPSPPPRTERSNQEERKKRGGEAHTPRPIRSTQSRAPDPGSPIDTNLKKDGNDGNDDDGTIGKKGRRNPTSAKKSIERRTTSEPIASEVRSSTGVPMPSPPRINQEAKLNTLDDVLQRGLLLRRQMDTAVMTYETPSLQLTETAAIEGRQETVATTTTTTRDPLSTSALSSMADLPLDELLRHVQKHVLEPAHGGDDDGMSTAQHDRSIAAGVPLEALVGLSPEFNDRTLTDEQLEDLAYLTKNAEIEVERQSSPYPSLDALHDGVWEMLKSARKIELVIERLVVVPNRKSSPRTTQRPFRPEERNWCVAFDELDMVGIGGNSNDGNNDNDGSNQVVMRTSKANDRKKDDPNNRRTGGIGRKKSKTDSTVDIPFVLTDEEGNTIKTNDSDVSYDPHTMNVSFNDQLVAKWSSSGIVIFNVSVSRIQPNSRKTNIPGLRLDEVAESKRKNAQLKEWGTCTLSLRTVLMEENMSTSVALPVLVNGEVRGFLDVCVKTIFDEKYGTKLREKRERKQKKQRLKEDEEKKEQEDRINYSTPMLTSDGSGGSQKIELSLKVEEKVEEKTDAMMSNSGNNKNKNREEDEEVDEEVEEVEENVTEARMLVRIEKCIFHNISSGVGTLRVIHRPWQCSHPSTRGTSVLWVEECDGDITNASDINIDSAGNTVVDFNHRSLSTIHLVEDGKHCWNNMYIIEVWLPSKESSGRLVGLVKIPMFPLSQGLPTKKGNINNSNNNDTNNTSNNTIVPGVRTIWNGQMNVIDVLNSNGNGPAVVGVLQGSIVVGDAESMDIHVEKELEVATSPRSNRSNRGVEGNKEDLMVVGQQSPVTTRTFTLPSSSPPSFSSSFPYGAGVRSVRHEYTLRLVSAPGSNQLNNPVFVRYIFPAPTSEDEGVVHRETTLWCDDDSNKSSGDSSDSEDINTQASHVLRLPAGNTSNLHQYLCANNENEERPSALRFDIWRWSDPANDRCERIGIGHIDLDDLATMTTLVDDTNRSAAQMFEVDVEMDMETMMSNENEKEKKEKDVKEESKKNVNKKKECLLFAVQYTKEIENDEKEEDIVLSSTTTTTTSAVPRTPCIAIRINRANVVADMESERPYVLRLTTPDGMETVTETTHTLIDAIDPESGRPMKSLIDVRWTIYWPFDMKALPDLVTSSMSIDMVMIDDNGRGMVVGKTQVPLASMFERSGMTMDGWYDVVAPDGDEEENGGEDTGVVGEIKVDMMLASMPEEKEEEQDEEVEEDDDDDDENGENGENEDRIKDSFKYFAHSVEEHLNAVIHLDTSIMSDDSLEEEDIEFVEDMDPRMPPTEVLPFDTFDTFERKTRQEGHEKQEEQEEQEEQRWGSIEVSILRGMHLVTTPAAQIQRTELETNGSSLPQLPQLPQLYVSYRWDITSPVISTPLVRSLGTQSIWEHTRLVSVPKSDLTISKLSQRVVLCSVWERPPWTRTMFTPIVGDNNNNNDPTSMLMTSDGAVAGSTLPGDRLVGICRIPLSSLSRSMPVIDGWYNVYNSGQSPSGQLRVRVAPNLSNVIDIVEENKDYKDNKDTKDNDDNDDKRRIKRIDGSTSSTLSTAVTSSPVAYVAYEHKYSGEDTHTSTLSLLKNVVKDLDEVQNRLRTNVGTNSTSERRSKMITPASITTNNSNSNNNNTSTNNGSNNNPGGTVNASKSNYYSHVPITTSSAVGVIAPHIRVTTSMSNSPSNWLAQRPQQTSSMTRKRSVSGAST